MFESIPWPLVWMYSWGFLGMVLMIKPQAQQTHRRQILALTFVLIGFGGFIGWIAWGIWRA